MMPGRQLAHESHLVTSGINDKEGIVRSEYLEGKRKSDTNPK